MFELVKRGNNLNVLAISDLHIGNLNDCIDLVDNAYSYAQDKNIKYVLNLGDLIEGVMPHNKKELRIGTTLEQVDCIIENYPKIDGIKTLMLYGNHDYYSLYKKDIDVAKVISSKRRDIYNLGYGEAYIRILDNYIKLSHEIDLLKGYKKNIETFVNLVGHLHSFKLKVYDDTLYINVPPLSKVSPNKQIYPPSILDINFIFYKSLISNVEINLIDMTRNMVIGSFELASSINNKKYVKIKKQLDDYKI